MRTSESAKVMRDRAYLYENFREREGDDEGHRAISMRTSESAKVKGDRAISMRTSESAKVKGDRAISMRTLERAKAARGCVGSAVLCRKRGVATGV